MSSESAFKKLKQCVRIEYYLSPAECKAIEDACSAKPVVSELKPAPGIKKTVDKKATN